MGERVASHSRIGRLGRILEKPRYQAARTIHRNSLCEPKWEAPQGGTAMARRLALMAVFAFLLTPPSSVRAQFGGGTQIVFDPSIVRSATAAAPARDSNCPHRSAAASVHDQEHHRRIRRRVAIKPVHARRTGRDHSTARRTLLFAQQPAVAVPTTVSRLHRPNQSRPTGSQRTSPPR